MKFIPVVSAGSYYKNNSPAAGPNASRMQGLVWHAKANRDPPLSSTWLLEHPRHPSGRGVHIRSAVEAYEYAADVLQTILLPGTAPPTPVCLVPIPASNTTRANLHVGRWPARELARRLAARGVGRVLPALAHRQVTASRAGERDKTASLLANLEVVAAPAAHEFVVFVDDVITWGEHLAAADALLCPSRVSAAVAIGVTHAVTRDAYDIVQTNVTYGPDGRGGWTVLVQPPA